MPNSFLLNLDVSDITALHENLASQIEQKTNEAVERLAIMAHSHMLQFANNKLKTTRDKFIQSLKIDQVDEHTWAITIPKEAMWIENGLPANFDMLPGLLASPKAKTGPNGRYIVIPFKHNKSPTKQTNLEQILNKYVKQEMSQRGIPYGTIEKKPDGSPKLGRLHSFNVATPPFSHSPKVGQHGPSGHRLGIQERPHGAEGPSGRPFLWNAKVYQKEVEGVGAKKIERNVMTFRTASDSQMGKGMWINPGKKPLNSIEEAFEYVTKEWENNILPGILRDLGI
jgi:hypothetical protein